MTLQKFILLSCLMLGLSVMPPNGITANAEGLPYDRVATDSNVGLLVDTVISTNSNSTPPENAVPEGIFPMDISVHVKLSLEEELAIVPFSSFDNYSGSISTTILAYFEGIVRKFPYGMKYVVYRSTDYDYYLAYSTDLKQEGTRITSPLVNLVHYYSRNGVTVSSRTDTNFRFNLGDSIYYSNVAMDSPEIVGGWYQYEKYAVIFAFAFLLVFYLSNSILSVCVFRW